MRIGHGIIIHIVSPRPRVISSIYICPSVPLVIHDIFIFVPVWQKNNKSLTPVSQVNYRNFCPNITSLCFTDAYQWINARAWTGRRLKL